MKCFAPLTASLAPGLTGQLALGGLPGGELPSPAFVEGCCLAEAGLATTTIRKDGGQDKHHWRPSPLGQPNVPGSVQGTRGVLGSGAYASSGAARLSSSHGQCG